MIEGVNALVVTRIMDVDTIEADDARPIVCRIIEEGARMLICQLPSMRFVGSAAFSCCIKPKKYCHMATLSDKLIIVTNLIN